MTISKSGPDQSGEMQEKQQDEDIPRIKVSDLAQSQFFQCDKHVKLTASNSRGCSTQHEIKPSTREHQRRGDRFEAELLAMLGDAVVDHTDTSVRDSKQVLRQAKVGQILYQLRLEVPEDFYGDQNVYRLRTFIPDFLRIQEDPVTKARSIFIIDAKSSEALSSSHQFQVASYGYLLSHIIKGIRNLQVDSLGGVWLPSAGLEPETFRIDLMTPKMRRFYSIELVNIINNRKVHWLYNAKCVNCSFTGRCRKEAVGTWGAIPYMTERKVATLQKRAVDDIEDLATSLQKLRVTKDDDEDELADKLKSLAVSDTARHHRLRSKELRPFEEAYKTKKPQFLGKPIVSMAKEIDHDIILSIIVDPKYRRPCAYGIEVFDAVGKGLTRHVRSISPDERTISKFTELGTRLIDDLKRILSNMEDMKSRCTIIVPDSETNRSLRKCLYDIILCSDPKYNVSSTTQENAMRCLLAIFQDTQVLGIPGVKTYSTGMNAVATGRVASMQQLISSNVALGIPGYYTFADIARWMVLDEKPEAHNMPVLELLEGKAIFNAWLDNNDGDETSDIHDLITTQTIWLHRILRRFRRMIDDYVNSTGTDVYCLECKPFAWPELQTFRSPLLGRLSFFKKLEAVGYSDSLRAARIADFCGDADKSADKFRLCFTGYKEDYTPVRKKKRLLACFDVVPEETGISEVPLELLTETLSTKSLKEYILVEDSQEGILQAIRFPDLIFRASQRVDDLVTLVNVDHIMDNGISIALHGYFRPLGLKRGSYYRLYKRYVDYNSDKVLTGLKNMDNMGRETTFEKLVRDPNGWAREAQVPSVSSEARATALRLRDDFAMSPSQKEISAQVIQSRLQIVWGPPGSGKTEFLALFLVWYITHLHQNEGRPLLIGVTAFTRHAIMNLLERVSTVRSRHRDTTTSDFHIISMESGKAIHDDMTVCKANDLPEIFAKLHRDAKAVVVGGTVWDWYKVKNKWASWQGCDMMIVDESSQLLAADAALAIDCLEEEAGRLIIAGDHMQLGPILQNVYPKLPIKEPLLFGSIQQCLMRTKDNYAIRPQEFVLKKGVTPDFGPNTIQLRDNWRMNEELNSFFKQIYGSDLWARYPKLRLCHDWTKISGIYDTETEDCIRRALDPNKSITIVRVPKSSKGQPEGGYDVFSETETEAQIVTDIVNAHLTARLDPQKKPVSSMLQSNEKPHVMVVTPHHRQRLAVERRLTGHNHRKFLVNTVEKMQGQECELVVACFAFREIADTRADFLLDFKRWNVAVSRARCKVILITTEDLLDMPNGDGRKQFEIFKNRGSADGWGFVCMLEQWAKKAGSIVDWPTTETENSSEP